MKNISITITMMVLMLISSECLLAKNNSDQEFDDKSANSGTLKVGRIELRESGIHSIYFLDLNTGMAVTVPDEGCTFVDRAVIVENDAFGVGNGTNTIINAIIKAKIESFKVIIRVDGCHEIALGATNFTAPEIISFLLK